MVGGVPSTQWVTISEALPCLLDTGTAAQPEPTYTATQQQTLDRSGVLFSLPASDLKAGDRLTFTRGQTGNFVVKADPANISTLNGPHHREHRVEETP